MSERDIPPYSPEDSVRTKDNILEQWEKLPPEDQASMALALLRQALEGEHGAQVRGAIEALWREEVGAEQKLLPIISVSRGHLNIVGFSEAEIALLDEDDLRDITHDIMRHFANDAFWEELEFMATRRIEQKQSS